MIFVHSQSQEISSGEVSLLVHISEKCDGIISFSQSCEFFVRSFRVLEILPAVMDATHKRLLETVSAQFWLFRVAQEEL
jgi:hypothetical protein